MTMKITPAIMMALSLFAIASNARAEIASKQYVDEKGNLLIFGEADPKPSEISNLEEQGGVSGLLSTMNNDVIELNRNSISTNQNTTNGIVVTDDDGEIKIATGGYVTNSVISSNANIDLNKLHLPTPPSACNTRGCMLMFYNNQYVWEPVTRDNNETISTTGSVRTNNMDTNNSATLNSITHIGEEVDPHGCPDGYEWDGTECVK